MRLHLKVINDELARLGYTARLEKGAGSLDRTVRVRKINSRTLKQWIEAFRRLKALNEQILRTVKPGGTPEALNKEEPNPER
jgi:hypothetical protein